MFWEYRNGVPCLYFHLYALSWPLTRYVSTFIGYLEFVFTCLCYPWEMFTNACLGVKVISILFSDFWTSGEGKAWCWKGKTREASGALLRAEDPAGQLSWVHEGTVTATTEEGQ